MESKQESAAWADKALREFLSRCLSNVREEYMRLALELGNDSGVRHAADLSPARKHSNATLPIGGNARRRVGGKPENFGG